MLNKIYVLLWRMSRELLFRDLANAMQRRVGIREFLTRELSNSVLTKDAAGKAVMNLLLVRLAGGDGDTLQNLFRGIAPGTDQILLATVDDAKDKVGALEALADTIAFKQRSLKLLAVNLAVPVLALPLVGGICLLTSEAIASIAQSAPPAVWVGFNGFVRSLADFINAYWALTFTGIVGACVALVMSLSRWTGPVRGKVEEWPVFDLYRNFNAAIVLSALAMIISNGKTLREALDVLRVGASPWLAWQLRMVIHSLEDNPSDYAAAFGKGILPLRVRGRLMSLSDSAPTFDAALVQLGMSETARLETAVKVAAVTVNWTLTGILLSVALTLGIGPMTIASALSQQSSLSNMRQGQ
jgi:hypothetical protein